MLPHSLLNGPYLQHLCHFKTLTVFLYEINIVKRNGKFLNDASEYLSLKNGPKQIGTGNIRPLEVSPAKGSSKEVLARRSLNKDEKSTLAMRERLLRQGRGKPKDQGASK